MSHIKRKYIDSHWLVFIFQGAVALLFGCLMLFTAQSSSLAVVPIIGIAALALSVVEFANSLHRSHLKAGWFASTFVAVFDAIFGISLLMLAEQGMAWHLFLLGAYTIIRGIFELVIGFRTTVDPTDRFIWVLCGVCGLVFGVAILNSGHLAGVDFVRFFGAYLLILGVGSLIYGAHNRTQQLEDREYRREVAAKSHKNRDGAAKSPKKSPNKSKK